MSYDTLQATILGILGLLGVVLPAAIVLGFKLWTLFITQRAELKSTAERLDRQGRKIEQNQADITTVALASSPPAASPSTTVNVNEPPK